MLSTLTSKKKPSLNLKKPKSNHPSLAPKPNVFDNKKKSFTTPSGKTKPTNIDNAVPNIQPKNIINNIKYIDFLFIFSLKLI